MIRRQLVGRKPAAWGSLLLLLGAGLLGCTSPDAPSDDSRVADQPKHAPEQAIDTDGHGTGFSMIVTPEAVGNAPGPGRSAARWPSSSTGPRAT